MRLLNKILLIFILSIFIINVVPNFSMADDGQGYLENVINEFKPKPAPIDTTTNLVKIINRFLGFLQIISGLVLIITIATTGFNYIISTTPNVKQEIKKQMLPIIIGLILVFGAVSIAIFIMGSVEYTTQDMLIDYAEEQTGE